MKKVLIRVVLIVFIKQVMVKSEGKETIQWCIETNTKCEWISICKNIPYTPFIGDFLSLNWQLIQSFQNNTILGSQDFYKNFNICITCLKFLQYGMVILIKKIKIGNWLLISEV